LTEKRSLVLRWTASALVWFLLAGCFFSSLKAVSLTSEAASYIRGRALTPDAARAELLARETARAFAVEWATFDSKDGEDYARRLSAFVDSTVSLPSPPEGVQKCLSSSVLSVETPKAPNEAFRVKVALHVLRLVPLSSEKSVSVSPAREASFREARVGTVESGSEKEVYYWKDFVEFVEVPVRVVDGEAVVAGWPVLVPSPLKKAEAFEGLSLKGDVPSDFSAFAAQALEFYYGGRNMANFTAPGAKVAPLGGFKLESAEVVTFKAREGRAKAVVKATVSGEGAGGLVQFVTVEAIKKDRWLLTRVGAL